MLRISTDSVEFLKLVRRANAVIFGKYIYILRSSMINESMKKKKGAAIYFC